jgi:hypothetical protein
MTVYDSPMWAVVVLGLSVLSAMLYGIAALWASSGSKGWLWRWAPLTLLLTALAPIGAYELIAYYGAQATVIVGFITLRKWVQGRRAKRRARVVATTNSPNECLPHARRAPPQFLLGDMLKAILLAAVVLALIRHAAPGTEAILGRPINRRQWLVAGVVFGVITLAAAWAVCGQRRRYLRAIVLVLVTAAAGGVLDVFDDPFGITFTTPFKASTSAWRWCLSLTGSFGLLVAIWLLLVRRAGWAWWRRDVTVDEAHPSGTQDHAAAQDRWRWPARIAACAISLFGGWMLGSVFWALLPPVPPHQDPLPTPNGYDDLLRAGTAINWTAIPNKDIDTATIEACQAFLQANASSLASMRHAFSKPCRVPFDFAELSSSMIEINFISAVRDLDQALSVEGRVGVAKDRFGDAMQSYLDTMRLAQKLSFRGLLTQELTANNIEYEGLQGIADEMNHLDAASLALLVQTLDGFLDLREPLEKVLDRDQAWRKLEYGWIGALLFWLEETLEENSSSVVLSSSRARGLALLRLILAEAAVRRHVLNEGSPPESLASLVPKYLSAVPQDPFGNGPLKYRRTADGYLLYSVGGNGTDDGGQRVSAHEATFERKGDLFFDASPFPPEEPADTPESP